MIKCFHPVPSMRQCLAGAIVLCSAGVGVSDAQDFDAVASVGGLYVAAGSGLARSSNGVSWTSATSISTQRWHGITGGRFPSVAVGDHGIVASSADGRDWTLRASGTSLGLRAAVQGQGQWLAVGGSNDGAGLILVSTNAETWAVCRSDISNRLDLAMYSGGRFLAAGQRGVVLVSSNGWDWQYGNTGSTQNWTAATFGQSQYRLFGEAGSMSSDDGLSWILSTAPAGQAVRSVVNCGTVFGAVGGSNVWGSLDGRTWNLHPMTVASGTVLRALTFGQNRFVPVGLGSVGPLSYTGLVTTAGGGAAAGASASMTADRANSLASDSGQPQARIQLPFWRVDLSTLELILEGTLFSAPPSPVGPLELRLGFNSRTYRELAPGVFGRGWMASFEECVVRYGTTNDTLLTHTGERLVWSAIDVPGGDRKYFPPSGYPYQLASYDTYGTFFERRPWGKPNAICFSYSPNVGTSDDHMSRLTSVGDMCGNGIGVERDYGNPVDFTGSIITRVLQNVHDDVDNAHPRALTLDNYVTRSWHGTNVYLCGRVVVPDGRTISFEYDSEARLTAITDMQGYRATFAYGAAGVVSLNVEGKDVGFSYQADGAISEVSDSSGAKHYSRGDNGIVCSSAAGRDTMIPQNAGMTGGTVDPLGNTWIVDYDYGVRKPSVITDPQGQSTTFEYDARGNMVSQTDARNGTTHMQYAANNNNMLAVTTPLGETWGMDYDDIDRLVAVHAPDGSTSGCTYDEFGQVISLTDFRGGVTSLQRDEFGNVVQMTNPEGGVTAYEYEASGLRCTQITDARGNVKTLTYDANDRITQVVSGGQTRRMEYDAFGQTKFTDAAGFIHLAERNARGDLTKLTDPLGGVSLFTYDADGMLLTATDPRGYSRALSYDKAGRLERETDEAGCSVRSERDSSGRPISWINKRGCTTAFQYNENGQLSLTTPPMGSGTGVDYDAANRPVRWTRSGQIVEVDYDSNGRILHKRHNGSQVAAYSYDLNGNLLTVVDALGTTTFTYDLLNRATAIAYPTMGVSFVYDAVGNRTRVTYPDGTISSCTYDNANRLLIPGVFRSGKATELPGLGEPPNRVVTVMIPGNIVTLAYDADMRLSAIHRLNGIDSALAYDGNGRCTHFEHKSGALNLFADFTYDAAGNCLSENLGHTLAPPLPAPFVQATYDAGDRIAAADGRTFDHDANGNVIAAGTYTATYDVENRLVSLTRGGATTQYKYNGLGWLVQKIAGGRTIDYRRDPSGALLAETEGGVTLVDYYCANGRLIAFGRDVASLRYVHADPRGNVLALSDASGAVVANYAYSPFGTCVANGATNGNAVTFAGSLGVRDEGGGIFFMRNRFYDATVGRFISSDPLGLAAGGNLYAYAANNPVRFADPSGLMPDGFRDDDSNTGAPDGPPPEVASGSQGQQAEAPASGSAGSSGGNGGWASGVGAGSGGVVAGGTPSVPDTGSSSAGPKDYANDVQDAAAGKAADKVQDKFLEKVLSKGVNTAVGAATQFWDLFTAGQDENIARQKDDEGPEWKKKQTQDFLEWKKTKH